MPSRTLWFRFVMYECTRYYDKNRPTWNQMEKLAIRVEPGTLKPVGFKTGVGFDGPRVTVGAEDEDDDD